MIRSSEWVRSRHRVRSHYRCRIVRDNQGVLDDRQESHLADTVGADERVHLVGFLDQAREGAAGRVAKPGIRFDGFIRGRCRQRRLRPCCLSCPRLRLLYQP
jgi:hypothetical protein